MKIGIPGWESDGVFGVSTSYMSFVTLVGTPIILSPGETSEEVRKKVDGILLPGGGDINSNRYGKFPGFHTGKPNPFLENFDTLVLPKLVEELPVFGICRGLQTLNILFGGTLNQHLFIHPYSTYDLDLVHEVTTKENAKFKTNSFHHQAISSLGPQLTMEASYSSVVEAISHKTLPIFAVQWHPERCWDEYSMSAFCSLFS